MRIRPAQRARGSPAGSTPSVVDAAAALARAGSTVTVVASVGREVRRPARAVRARRGSSGINDRRAAAPVAKCRGIAVHTSWSPPVEAKNAYLARASMSAVLMVGLTHHAASRGARRFPHHEAARRRHAPAHLKTTPGFHLQSRRRSTRLDGGPSGQPCHRSALCAAAGVEPWLSSVARTSPAPRGREARSCTWSASPAAWTRAPVGELRQIRGQVRCAPRPAEEKGPAWGRCVVSSSAHRVGRHPRPTRPASGALRSRRRRNAARRTRARATVGSARHRPRRGRDGARRD